MPTKTGHVLSVTLTASGGPNSKELDANIEGCGTVSMFSDVDSPIVLSAALVLHAALCLDAPVKATYSVEAKGQVLTQVELVLPQK